MAADSHEPRPFSESLLNKPAFPLLDIDDTVFFGNPQELADAVEELNLLASPEYNLYSTFCTQHLCAKKEYSSVFDLRWDVGGKIVAPPLELEFGTVYQFADQKQRFFSRFKNFNFADYAKEVRPEIMNTITELFPGMTTFEEGMVMIGAELNEEAIAHFGNGNQMKAKKEMKAILDQALIDKGLANEAVVSKHGKDLDVMPWAAAKFQKLIGVHSLSDILLNDQNFAPLRPYVNPNRFALADDKGYAAEHPGDILNALGGQVVLPSTADKTLVDKFGSKFRSVKRPNARQVIRGMIKSFLAQQLGEEKIGQKNFMPNPVDLA